MHLRSCIFFAGLSLAPASLFAATTIVRGPYLQTATPTSLVVRWRTDVAEASMVRYGLAKDQLTSSAKAEGIVTEHIVQLNGLQPVLGVARRGNVPVVFDLQLSGGAGPVTDLIVVLRADDELPPFSGARTIAVPPLPVRGILACIDEILAIGVREVHDAREVRDPRPG